VRNSGKVLAVKPDGEERLAWLQVNVMLLKLALGRLLDRKEQDMQCRFSATPGEQDVS